MKSEYKTKSRNLIVEYLKNNSDRRFTARDILDALFEVDPKINKSTIYRNLERLVQDGKLIKFKEASIDATCYQYSESHSHCHEHMHAQCSGCGKIFHLDNEIVEEFETKLQSVYGLGVDIGKTVIVGQCDDCKSK